MRNFLLLFLLIPLISFSAQTNHPKREFRAVWIATVANLDWPGSPYQSSDDQKADLIKLLDKLKAAGINAVIFQVRSECDAMYDSKYEPWSYYLTGVQGKAPSPYYDPLEFAIKEAHKRGMELHAWFNPYRAERRVGIHPLASNHVVKRHPEWTIRIGNFRFLDPGIPAVREYVKNVIMDVVTRYDVDGVHFDDYFYPYPPNQITNQDDSTFAKYSDGYTNIGDWRRHNVNLLVKMVHEAIDSVKPWVKFGISPFGIWKPSNPPGISGMNAYSTIYCDALAWLKSKTVDYLTPQLYWVIGGAQDYSKLMPWWASKINGRHLYPGQALYRVSKDNWSATEMPRQIKLNRAEKNCEGSVFFRAQNIPENPKGFEDSLKNNYYKYPSLMPVMSWKDSIPPNAPQFLTFTKLPGKPVEGLIWNKPGVASDGDTAYHYVVYNFYSGGMGPLDFDSGENIKAITVTNNYVPPSSPEGDAPRYFAVSAVDRINNESEPTDLIEIPQPVTPLLASPSNGTENVADSLVLKWHFADNASFYDLQISHSPSFDSLDVEASNLQDTSYLVSGLTGLTQYYWRVRSTNVAGASNFSEAFSFTTGFPRVPLAVYPPDLTLDVPTQITFEWSKSKGAVTYGLQLSTSLSFTKYSMVVDTSGLVDTSFTAPELQTSRIYFWRISANNQTGCSGWSAVYRFKTASTSGVVAENLTPETFKLFPNYPNPFGSSNGVGATTKIKFTIPAEGIVTLKVYDILGRKVAELVDGEMNAGSHVVNFNADKLNSGIYIYVLNFNGKRLIGKMMFIK